MTRVEWVILGALILLEAVAIYVAARLLARVWDMYRRPRRSFDGKSR